MMSGPKISHPDDQMTAASLMVAFSPVLENRSPSLMYSCSTVDADLSVTVRSLLLDILLFQFELFLLKLLP